MSGVANIAGCDCDCDECIPQSQQVVHQPGGTSAESQTIIDGGSAEIAGLPESDYVLDLNISNGYVSGASYDNNDGNGTQVVTSDAPGFNPDITIDIAGIQVTIQREQIVIPGDEVRLPDGSGGIFGTVDGVQQRIEPSLQPWLSEGAVFDGNKVFRGDRISLQVSFIITADPNKASRVIIGSFGQSATVWEVATPTIPAGGVATITAPNNATGNSLQVSSAVVTINNASKTCRLIPDPTSNCRLRYSFAPSFNYNSYCWDIMNPEIMEPDCAPTRDLQPAEALYSFDWRTCVAANQGAVAILANNQTFSRNYTRKIWTVTQADIIAGNLDNWTELAVSANYSVALSISKFGTAETDLLANGSDNASNPYGGGGDFLPFVTYCENDPKPVLLNWVTRFTVTVVATQDVDGTSRVIIAGYEWSGPTAILKAVDQENSFDLTPAIADVVFSGGFGSATPVGSRGSMSIAANGTRTTLTCEQQSAAAAAATAQARPSRPDPVEHEAFLYNQSTLDQHETGGATDPETLPKLQVTIGPNP